MADPLGSSLSGIGSEVASSTSNPDTKTFPKSGSSSTSATTQQDPMISWTAAESGPQPTEQLTDPSQVPNLVAQWIVSTANTARQTVNLPPVTVSPEYIASQISEITPETQTSGAALLSIQLIDPDWTIQRSGICDCDADGLLQQVDINYPDGTDVWWRLAMVDGGNDMTDANLTLTFQHRIITYLMDDWGPLQFTQLPGAHNTRAQFIKDLADRIPTKVPKGSLGPGSADSQKITFICPELNVIQPVASSDDSSTEVITADSQQKLNQKVNKQPGVTKATNVTAKGSPLSASQANWANMIIQIGEQMGASTTAIEIVMIQAIAESDLGVDMNWNPTYGGLLFGNVNTFGSLGDAGSVAVAQAEIKAAFSGGKGFASGGAIGLAKNSSDTFSAAETNSGSGTQYAAEAGSSNFASEAAAIVAAGGAGNLTGSGSSSGSSGSSSSSTPTSDIGELARGTDDDPDEDSWTCMQRLAQEVNWLIFSDPHPAPGIWGNFLYYISAPDLAAQIPALYLTLSDDGTTFSAEDTFGNVVAGDGVITNLTYTCDNTSFLDQQTRKVKGKTLRATRIRTPQTPTQVKFNMLCYPLDFNAGDVFVFRNAGMLSGNIPNVADILKAPTAPPSTSGGRWIVEDVTHNSLNDLFAQFTLGPPTYPYPEPQSSTSSSSSGSGGGGNTSGGPSATVDGYTNPLQKIQGLQPLRIDQGVDYSGSGPLVALGDGQIVVSSTSAGWPGGGAVVLKLSNGSFQGKTVYYCENLTPTVSNGQTVKVGQTIATLHDASPNMEIGWASGDTDEPLAQQLGQNAQQTGQDPNDPGGCQSAAGRDFNKLLVALGAPSGGPGSGPISTGPGMPSGWPSLS